MNGKIYISSNDVKMEYGILWCAYCGKNAEYFESPPFHDPTLMILRCPNCFIGKIMVQAIVVPWRNDLSLKNSRGNGWTKTLVYF